MSTSIPKRVTCPRCFSHNLYLYGKDPRGFQKYQCKDCRRQFAPDAPVLQVKRKYPLCPVCGKGTFLHHDYDYYSNFRCNDRQCNHSFRTPKLVKIQDTSTALIEAEAFTMKHMRHSLRTVLAALFLYFQGNASLRAVSMLLQATQGVAVSHVTISNWIKRFTPALLHASERYRDQINLSDSDEWHLDETYVDIAGEAYYLWICLDAETRMVVDFHLAPKRDSEAAYRILNACCTRHGGPQHALVTDRYFAYEAPAGLLYPRLAHIQVEDFDDWISNNVIESFNGTFKAWYKAKRGFNAYASANTMVACFVFFYNFVRPHSALDGMTPAQVAGATFGDKERHFWHLAA